MLARGIVNNTYNTQVRLVRELMRSNIAPAMSNANHNSHASYYSDARNVPDQCRLQQHTFSSMPPTDTQHPALASLRQLPSAMTPAQIALSLPLHEHTSNAKPILDALHEIITSFANSPFLTPLVQRQNVEDFMVAGVGSLVEGVKAEGSALIDPNVTRVLSRSKGQHDLKEYFKSLNTGHSIVSELFSSIRELQEVQYQIHDAPCGLVSGLYQLSLNEGDEESDLYTRNQTIDTRFNGLVDNAVNQLFSKADSGVHFSMDLPKAGNEHVCDFNRMPEPSAFSSQEDYNAAMNTAMYSVISWPDRHVVSVSLKAVPGTSDYHIDIVNTGHGIETYHETDNDQEFNLLNRYRLSGDNARTFLKNAIASCASEGASYNKQYDLIVNNEGLYDVHDMYDDLKARGTQIETDQPEMVLPPQQGESCITQAPLRQLDSSLDPIYATAIKVYLYQQILAAGGANLPQRQAEMYTVAPEKRGELGEKIQNMQVSLNLISGYLHEEQQALYAHMGNYGMMPTAPIPLQAMSVQSQHGLTLPSALSLSSALRARIDAIDNNTMR